MIVNSTPRRRLPNHTQCAFENIRVHPRPKLSPTYALSCRALSPHSCATAYILLAEEEATTIVDAEKLFKQALKAGEGCYRRSQQLQHHGSQYEAQHSEWGGRGRIGTSAITELDTYFVTGWDTLTGNPISLLYTCELYGGDCFKMCVCFYFEPLGFFFYIPEIISFRASL